MTLSELDKVIQNELSELDSLSFIEGTSTYFKSLSRSAATANMLRSKIRTIRALKELNKASSKSTKKST